LDRTRLNSDDAERLHAASLFPISHGIFRLARAHRAYAADLLREQQALMNRSVTRCSG
jgi:hypothetical protein